MRLLISHRSLRRKVAVDHVFQMRAGDYPSLSLHQGEQGAIFMNAETHRLARTGDDASRRIDRDVPIMKHRSHAPCRASQNGPQAREELIDLEWLDDVVVRAGVEAVDAITELIPCGDDEGRRCVIAAAERMKHIDAGTARQAEIEQQRRVSVIDQRNLRGAGVVRRIDMPRVLPKRGSDRFGQHSIVFDQKDARLSHGG